MSEKDPFKVLEELEARVKKSEERLPYLEKDLAVKNEYIQKLEKEVQNLGGKWKRYEKLEAAVLDIVGELRPSGSSGASGTLEIHDPVKPIAVKDPQEKLVAETTTVIGQLGECIIAGYITPKRLRVGEIEEMLSTHFNAGWGKGQVQQGLETLTAPPYRLFMHTVDSQKRHWFELRDGLKERVVKD